MGYWTCTQYQKSWFDQAGVELGEKGEIKVDKYSSTSQAHILAIGDCTNRLPLTPVAKAEGEAAVATPTFLTQKAIALC